MRIGLALAQYGRFATPSAVVEVAQAAERADFASLWVGDRLFVPVDPRDHYPGGALPGEYRSFLDPLAVLTTAAAVTSTIRLGTSTLNATWHQPALLARTLGTIAVLSGDRLDVGLGLGWSRDEYAAVDVPWTARGARLEEIIDVLTAWWTTNPVTHSGAHWRIPAGYVDVKPVRRPLIYLGGYSDATLNRVGRRADGWLPAGAPIDRVASGWAQARRAAEDAGRDPDTLHLVLRHNLAPDQPVGRAVDYLRAAADAGIPEAFVDCQRSARTVTELIETTKGIRDAVLGRSTATGQATGPGLSTWR